MSTKHIFRLYITSISFLFSNCLFRSDDFPHANSNGWSYWSVCMRICRASAAACRNGMKIVDFLFNWKRKEILVSYFFYIHFQWKTKSRKNVITKWLLLLLVMYRMCLKTWSKRSTLNSRKNVIKSRGKSTNNQKIISWPMSIPLAFHEIYSAMCSEKITAIRAGLSELLMKINRRCRSREGRNIWCDWYTIKTKKK